MDDKKAPEEGHLVNSHQMHPPNKESESRHLVDEGYQVGRNEGTLGIHSHRREGRQTRRGRVSTGRIGVVAPVSQQRLWHKVSQGGPGPKLHPYNCLLYLSPR